MSRKKLYITQDFIDQCTETINELGAVRRDSFLRFIELTLDVSPKKANDVLKRMDERNDIYITEYADMTIIKTDKLHKAAYKGIDVFEAFLYLYAEAKLSGDKEMAIANRATFPADYSIYVTTGIVYNTLLYDAHLPQKLSVMERQGKKNEHQATLIVLPAGTNLEKADIPELKDAYRLAVVRKTKNGNAVCQMTPLEGVS